MKELSISDQMSCSNVWGSLWHRSWHVCLTAITWRPSHRANWHGFQLLSFLWNIHAKQNQSWLAPCCLKSKAWNRWLLWSGPNPLSYSHFLQALYPLGANPLAHLLTPGIHHSGRHLPASVTLSVWVPPPGDLTSQGLTWTWPDQGHVFLLLDLLLEPPVLAGSVSFSSIRL